MSIKDTRERLERLLADPDERVIALSGAWGTGKSYLWNDIRQRTKLPKVEKALYISLFGLGDIKQLKLKLFQAYLPTASPKFEALARAGTNFFGVARRFATSLHAGFASLDELALMSLPQTMNGRFIVLDDIERRRDGFSIDEVLGFIDEFTQLHKARFMLILNTDRLADRARWDTFREKVIDTELRLITSPSESFEIASLGNTVLFSDEVRQALDKCKVSNIRVVRKVIKAVNAILAGHEHIAPEVRNRTIPSIVLLSAIAYKGIEDGPDLSFVLAVDAYDMSRAGKNEKNQGNRSEEQIEAEERRAKWRSLLDEVGVAFVDEFEKLVGDFLEFGLVDSGALSERIDRYSDQIDQLKTRDEAQQLLGRLMWDHKATSAELTDATRRLLARVKWLDPYLATAINFKLNEFDALSALAEEVIDAYLAEFSRTPVDQRIRDDSFNRPLHPRIAAAFAAANVAYESSTTLVTAVLDMVKNSGWSSREEFALSAASIGDFEHALRTLDSDSFRMFSTELVQRLLHKDQFPKFGSAMDNFAEACRNIVTGPEPGRLAQILQQLFESYGLSGLLTSGANLTELPEPPGEEPI